MSTSIQAQAQEVILKERIDAVGLRFHGGSLLMAKDFPEIKWAIPGLLPEGYGILGGRPKIGKSWLALDFSLAVSLGGFALGSEQYKAEPGMVLYLALEDSERRLQARQLKILGDERPDLLSRLQYATTWKRLDDGGLEALQIALEAVPDCRLLIIDTLARVKPRLKRGGDAYEHDMEIGGQLQALAHKFNVCLLVIHHTRKTKSEAGDFVDELAGSTGVTGAPDFVAALSRKRRDSHGILEITGKDIEEISIAVKFDDCKWFYEGDSTEFKISDSQRKVLELLKKSNIPCTPKEISQVTGINQVYVKEILKKLEDINIIAKISRGQYVYIQQ